MTNIEAIKILRFNAELADPEFEGALTLAISALKKQEKEFDEWCPDCKEYDKKNRCCHRFTKVIRQTVEECKREYANEGWIPVTKRLPEKDGRYLITDTTDGAKTQEGYFCRTRDGEPYWGYLHVIAWRPLPEPYKAEEES